MDKQQLEQRLWLGLRDLGVDRSRIAANVIDNMLDAAVQYATTRQVAFHAALSQSDTPGNVQLRREGLTEATRRTA